jgi:proton-dependent oligopeptide transporter, POT family
LAAENFVGLTLQKVAKLDVDQEKAKFEISASDHDKAESQTVSGHESIRIVDPDAYPPPTEEERTTLRKVYDTIPVTAWALCFVEMAERASYYGVKAAFNNYMQFPLPEGGPGTGAIDPNNPNDHAGALNLGLQTASAIGLLFTFLAYVIPIFGAWIADVKIGRYMAIVWGVLIGAGL